MTSMIDLPPARPAGSGPGVAGISLHAARTCLRASAALARQAVCHWLHAQRTTPGPYPFPCDEVCRHFRATGRLFADSGLIGDLREAADLLRDRPAAAGPDRLLRSWLPSTIDQEDGSYESYLGAELLRQVCGSAVGEAPGQSGDQLLAALIADLAAQESAVLAVTGGTGAQARRALAADRLRQHAAELAPAARPGACGPVVGRAVYLSLLPLTPLHDELMFLRVVQIFETVYQQTAARIVDAAAALTAGDPARAADRIDDATRRLAATPAVYRVLTLMPAEAFAVIRENSRGRSAIQSRSYRLVQAASSAPPAGSGPAPRSGWDRPTLEETYLRWAGRTEPAKAAQLGECLVRLDAGWRALKRTHWGITRKIIGNSPGTGGTSGVEYLARAAAAPLFPAITAAAGRSQEQG